MPCASARCDHRVGRPEPSADGVEERLVDDLDTRSAKSGGEHAGQAVDPACDVAKALGAVVGGIEAGHDGEQDLGGADVARRLLPPDVLLAGLERQPKGRPPWLSTRDADERPGSLR